MDHDDIKGKWLGDASPKDKPNDKELLDFLLNWLHIILIGGTTKKPLETHEFTKKLAERHGITLWDNDWIRNQLEFHKKRNQS